MNNLNQKGLSTTTLTIIILAIIIIAGGLWYALSGTNDNTNNSNNTNTVANGNANMNVNTSTAVNTNTETNSNTNTSTNTNSSVDTSDWELYVNSNHNFSLKFPRDWGFISEFDGSFNPDILSASYMTTSSFVTGTEDSGLMLSFTFGSGKTINDILNEVHTTSEGSSKLVISHKEVTLSSGTSTTVVKYDPTIKGHTTEYLFQTDSGVIALGLLSENDETVMVLNTFLLVSNP